MRVGCLHTAESNVAIFKAARDELDIELVHHVRRTCWRPPSVKAG